MDSEHGGPGNGAAAGGTGNGANIRRVPPQTQREPLTAIANRLKKAMGDTACGPLIAAGEVKALAEHWGDYKADAGGWSVSQWLVKTCGVGKDQAWFARRQEAVDRIGEHVRRSWDHDAAVWAVNAIKDPDHLRRLDAAVLDAKRENGGNPLPETSVVRLATAVLGYGRKVRQQAACKLCAAKDAEVARLKARVAELEAAAAKGKRAV